MLAEERLIHLMQYASLYIWIIEIIHESRKILVDNMIRQKYQC